MPYINTAKIEGFDGMTAEQKLDAILKVEIPDAVDTSKLVSKELFDRKASEVAALSKQLKEKMSDDEIKKSESEKAIAEMQAELESLRKEKTISDYTAKYIAIGYDKDLAAETAKAMADGDMAKVFENGEKHKTALEKKIKEDLINGTQKPGGTGGEGKGVDPAIEKAKALAKAKNGGEKTYAEIMSNYKK